MSSEIYIGCKSCKAAFHVGYLVTIKSNFVFYDNINMRALENFITTHTYCGPMQYPLFISEGDIELLDEDSWKLFETNGEIEQL